MGTLRALPVVVWALSLIGARLFVTDPISGYPAGTPPLPTPTVTGQLHDYLSLPGFVAILVAFFMLAVGRVRLWAGYQESGPGLRPSGRG